MTEPTEHAVRLMARLHGLAEGDGDCLDESLLRARARRLARPRHQAVQPSGTHALCVAVSSERYGIPLGALSEVMVLSSWTPVPGQPQYLLGVTNLRGEIRPVLNLHSLLGLEEASADDGPCWAVFVKSAAGEVGLRVDAVDQVRDLDASALTIPRDSGNGLPQRLVAGISPDAVILLDVPQILALDVLNDGRTAAAP